MNAGAADLQPEDAKIMSLARAGRARAGSVEGAAVRDLDGRTYAAVGVDLPSLRLSALQVAVALAVSSGAAGLEAAAVVTSSAPNTVDATVVADLGGGGVPVYVGGADGRLVETFTT